MSSLPTFIQEPKIFVAADAGSFEIVANNEDRHFVITRNYDRPHDAFPDIRTMAALLPCNSETGFRESSIEHLPVNGGELRHRLLNVKGQFPPFEAEPRRTLPFVPIPLIASFFKHVVKRPHIGARGDEQPDSVVQSRPRDFNGRSRTRHIERHRMSHELPAFFPNLNGVVDVHALYVSTNVHIDKEASLRSVES